MADFDRIATHEPRALVLPDGNPLYVWKASPDSDRFNVFSIVGYARSDLDYGTVSNENYFARWTALVSRGAFSNDEWLALQRARRAPRGGDIAVTFDGRARLPALSAAAQLPRWNINGFAVYGIQLMLTGEVHWSVGVADTANQVRADTTMTIYRPGTRRRFWYFLDDVEQADSLLTFGGAGSQVQGIEVEVRLRTRWQPFALLDSVILDDGFEYDIREITPATDTRRRFMQLRVSRVQF